MPHLAPENTDINLAQLKSDPYSVYKYLRANAPVCRVKATGRTMLTKAADIKAAKDNPKVFSSNDPNTPMARAFQAHTLMRKDGDEHRSERMAMAPAFSPRLIRDHWQPLYQKLAEDYVSKLPRGEVVDLFPNLAGPFAARTLASQMGMAEASDADMQRWSQTLIDGAGNFGFAEKLFDDSDLANAEMNALFETILERVKKTPDNSAFSAMVNAEIPIAQSQMYSNVKIAIGGGINEPRDALCTILFGLLDNPAHIAAVKDDPKWFSEAFEEGIRWVAPIQVSSRLVTEDIVVRDCLLQQGDTVMTIQASAGHDEEVHENGEVFDLFRAKKTHQSFGNGPHFCQGTHVARMMLVQIMLPMLFDRFPNMELADRDAVIWSGFGFRGPLNLPVHLK